MHWLIIVLLAVLVRAFYSVSTKTVANKSAHLSAATQAVVQTAVSALVSLAALPFVGGFEIQPIIDHWWVVAILVLGQGIGNVIYYQGQPLVDSGTTQVVLSSKTIWTAIFAALFLGSSFDMLQVLGIVVLMAAILLVQQKLSLRKVLDKGSALIAASAVAFTAFAVAGAYLSDVMNTGTYLIVVFGLSTVVSWLSAPKLASKEIKEMVAKRDRAALFISLAAIISMIYFAIVYWAYIAAPDAGIVAVLINAQVITTVLVATFVLGEKSNLPRKLAAGALVVISAYLIAGL